ncbi:MAG: nucleotidyltransferase family protein [Candidatus Atabeyarchaeum deiterrae]
MKVESAKKKLRELLPILRERFSIKRIGIFGSYVRGEQRRGSDLDILVDFYETIDLFQLVELEDFLSDELGVKVDLVLRNDLKPRIKDRILGEVVYV